MAVPTYSWNTINVSQCDADSPLDEVLMEALRQNQIHLEEWLGDGYTAAKNHDHDGGNSKLLPSGIVAQEHLKTTTGEVNGTGGNEYPSFHIGVSISTTTYITYITIVTDVYTDKLTLPGGTYGFYPQVRKDVSSNVGYAQQRYIQASPPYNLGNGDIPLFIFAVINSLGKIESVYTAEDPPWANNGPTDIRADYYRDGKGYQSRRQLPKLETVISDPKKFAEYLEITNAPLAEIEITQDIKNADMSLIPHPFIGNDLTGKTIIMLDPVGSFCEKLHQMALAGESINEILHKGYLKLDNTPLAANAPPGVMPVKANWK